MYTPIVRSKQSEPLCSRCDQACLARAASVRIEHGPYVIMDVAVLTKCPKCTVTYPWPFDGSITFCGNGNNRDVARHRLHVCADLWMKLSRSIATASDTALPVSTVTKFDGDDPLKAIAYTRVLTHAINEINGGHFASSLCCACFGVDYRTKDSMIIELVDGAPSVKTTKGKKGSDGAPSDDGKNPASKAPEGSQTPASGSGTAGQPQKGDSLQADKASKGGPTTVGLPLSYQPPPAQEYVFMDKEEAAHQQLQTSRRGSTDGTGCGALRHVHKCRGLNGRCGTIYEHQHRGGDKPHGQRRGACPNAFCDYYWAARHMPPDHVHGVNDGNCTYSVWKRPFVKTGPTQTISPQERQVERDLNTLISESTKYDSHPWGLRILAPTIPNYEKQDLAGIVFKILADDAPSNDKPAYQVGPLSGDAVHYGNHPASVGVSVNNRAANMAQPCSPSSEMLKKLNSMVDAFIAKTFTKKKILDWLDNVSRAPLKDICSGKWSAEALENAFKFLIAQGSDLSLKWQANVKQEVAQLAVKQGEQCHRPRLVQDFSHAGQLAEKIVMACFEALLFAPDAFEACSIKHMPKMSRVREIFSTPGPTDKVYEGDGSGWEYGVGLDLMVLGEQRIMEHIGTILFNGGDVMGLQEAWWQYAFVGRSSRKAKFSHKKGKNQASLTMRACRKSGDGITSSGNWFINALIWACILLDDPGAWVRDPKAQRYLQKDGSYVRFVVFFEGDDSFVVTDSPLSIGAIEEAWARLGFQMKLASREMGDRLVFVGVEGRRGSKAPPVPEIPRGLLNSGWSLIQPGSTEAENKDFARSVATAYFARAEMNATSKLMSSYYLALSTHWADKANVVAGDTTELCWEDQHKLFGKFEAGTKLDLRAKLSAFESTNTSADVVRAHFDSDENYERALRRVEDMTGGIIDLAVPLEEHFPGMNLPK